MYPTIIDMFNEWFGLGLPPIPLNTFGFFVAMAFIGAMLTLASELKRKEKLGLIQPMKVRMVIGKPPGINDLIMPGIIGFIIGLKLPSIILSWDTFVINPAMFIFSLDEYTSDYVFGIAGLIVAVAYRYYQIHKKKKDKPEEKVVMVHPHERVGDFTIAAMIAGLIGAKLFHNLENWDLFIQDPIGELLSFSGLTFYGGLIAGAAAVLYYAKKYNVKMLYMVDAAAPGLMLAYAIGRIGCQMAGDGDWGLPNETEMPAFLSFLPEWMWAFDYEGNVLGIDLGDANNPAEYGGHIYHGNAWPTPFYETIICGSFFAILWGIRKKITIPGVLFSIYLIMNGVERFFIEKIRINTTYKMFGTEITQAEIISTLLVLIGISAIIYLTRKKGKVLF